MDLPVIFKAFYYECLLYPICLVIALAYKYFILVFYTTTPKILHELGNWAQIFRIHYKYQYSF